MKAQQKLGLGYANARLFIRRLLRVECCLVFVLSSNKTFYCDAGIIVPGENDEVEIK